MRETRKLSLSLISSLLFFTLFLSACGGGGDTDGESAVSDLQGANPGFGSDGAAGSTIRISVDDRFPVGTTTGYLVELRDPNGLPLAGVRVICESEDGIAILEPIAPQGVSFESTDGNGTISGVIGGEFPGSYIFECRADGGFNLAQQVSIVITGSSPGCHRLSWLWRWNSWWRNV